MKLWFAVKKKACALMMVMLLTGLSLMSSCGSSAADVDLKDAFLKTFKNLDNEIEKMVDENVVLKHMSDLSQASYQLTAMLPGGLTELAFGGLPVPSEYVFSNDTENSAISLTAPFMGRQVGIYMDNDNIAVDFLSQPIVAGLDDLKDQLNSLMRSFFMTELPEELSNLDISYRGLLGSGDINQEVTDLKSAWDSLNMLNDFLAKTTIEKQDDADLLMQSGSVKASVFDVSMTAENFELWFDALTEKIENESAFDYIFNSLSTSAGITKEDAINEMKALDDFEEIENIGLRVYIYDGAVVKCEISDLSSGSISGSIALIGEINMTDKIEIASYNYDDELESAITMEGNLVPRDGMVEYSITVGDGTYNESVSFSWDLSETEADNLTVTTPDMNGFSMFFGLAGGDTAEIRINMNEYGFTSPLRFVLEPLSAEIVVPTSGFDLGNLDINEIVSELQGLFGGAY